MELTKRDVTKILKDPIAAAQLANLIYVTDTKLSIHRHRHGRGFYYTSEGDKIVDKKALKRFKSLVIPPAWEDVKITHLLNGHLQVVGRDEKLRKQYRYHPYWNKIRNESKFYKMLAFGKALPLLREQIAKDLRLRSMTKRKCLALVLRLMEETHIRIGNSYYANKNNTYGLSTLRTKHVDIIGPDLKFTFVGKKGKKHNISVSDKRLIKLVNECQEIPGWELFQYYDENGKHHSIDSGMVNDYIHEISGVLFSAKDFRTWAGSKIFFETLHELGNPSSATDTKANINLAFEATAKGLGNTKTVCKKYYVHPILPEKYENGSLQEYFNLIDTYKGDENNLEASENLLIKILKDYSVNSND